VNASAHLFPAYGQVAFSVTRWKLIVKARLWSIICQETLLSLKWCCYIRCTL